jgi:indoleacetamide hydrolase
VPAALCGIAGFRPTTRRYSTQGAAPISALFDQVGPHARAVADLVLFDRVGSGDERPIVAAPLKGVKLALAHRYFYAGLDPEVERLTTEALRKLKEAGVELVESDVPELAELVDLTTSQVQNHDVRIELAKYLARYGAGVSVDQVIARASPDIQQIFNHDMLPGGPAFVSEAEYRAAVDVHLPKLHAAYRDYFARTGAAALVFAATMVTAPRIGEESQVLIGGRPVPFDDAVARNIAPGSTAGLPGLVLPAGIAKDGLPVSLEFDGPAGTDRELLALGLAVEALLGPIAAPKG